MESTQNEIIDLNQYGNFLEKNLIGGKAWSVNLLANINIPTPEGICLTNDFFKIFLEKNNLVYKINRLLSSNDLSKKEKIRLLIYESDIPPYLQENLQTLLLRLSNSVAIRSSFPFEDTASSSGAGQFLTLLNITNNLENVCKSIKKCWLSVFDSIINLNEIKDIGAVSLAVIIQNYIKFEKNGVAFSKNPLDDQNFTLVESSTKDSSIVDGGDGSVSYYQFDNETKKLRESKTDECSSLSDKTLEQLYIYSDKISKLDAFSKTGVDIEWGVTSQEELFILQARPITTKSDYSYLYEENFHYIDIEDTIIPNIPFNKYYKGLVEHHWKKRHWMKEEASRFHLRVYQVGFIFIKKGLLNSNLINNFLDEKYPSKYLYVMLQNKKNNYDFVVLKSDFSKEVAKYFSQYDNETQIIIWVSEFFMPELAGLATKTTDSKFLIEYVKGDIAGLEKGGTNCSYILTDSNNNIIKKESSEVSDYYSFDSKGKSTLIKSNETSVINLSASIIRQINQYVEVMFNRFGECRVEWIFNGQEVIIFDLSIESQPIRLEKGLENDIISKGICRGPVLKLNDEDLLNLKEIISKRRSVVPSIAEIEAYTKDEVKEIKEQFLNRIKNRPVIIAPYPDVSLSIFIEDVEGFVFERGAIMSHLGIILRENEIPALIVKDALKQFNNTEHLMIEKGQLYKC